MTADNYAELVARLQDLAPRVDDITGPSSVVEIAAAKALREAAYAIDALRKAAEEMADSIFGFLYLSSHQLEVQQMMTLKDSLTAYRAATGKGRADE